MIRSLALSAALLAALAHPAAAKATLGPDDIAPGVYEIDSRETLLRYGVIHMGFSEYWGTFPGATGTLSIDPKALSEAKLEVTAPVFTISTTNRDLDGELISGLFFDAAKYPTLKFVSTSVTRTGPKTAKVAGDLTMHGITKPVVFDVTFIGAGPNDFTKTATLGFRAEGMVKRSDFGLGKWVPIVSDETTITISAAFEKKG